MTENHRSALVGNATRIAPRLWIGRRPLPGYAVALAGFHDLVLCAQEHQPEHVDHPGVVVHRCPLDDSGKRMTVQEQQTALLAGRRVAAAWHQGRRILVTCIEGRNRSGLVTALALMSALGLRAEDAITRVRSLRNRDLPANRPALVNEDFVEFLRTLRPPAAWRQVA